MKDLYAIIEFIMKTEQKPDADGEKSAKELTEGEGK